MDLAEEAIRYIKEHKGELIEKYASLKEYPPTKNPWSFFMAGSPGAGKTEISKNLIGLNAEISPDTKIVRIDADEIRSFLPFYTGNNSNVVQRASSLGVQKLFDSVLKNSQNFILDGTFANNKLAREDVKRCIDKGRIVGIWYVYQDPVVAWTFTKIREQKEGRSVPRSMFIRAFFAAKDNVNQIKKEFKEKVRVDLIIKDYQNKVQKIEFGIDKIDSLLKNEYTAFSLEKLLDENV